MNEEPDQLPLARMRTVSRPSFWLYFLACAILYIYITFTAHNPASRWRHSAFIAFGVFIALLLELISQWLRDQKKARFLVMACYIFEIASFITLVLIIFLK
jgi:hypothetical protein